jgi:hypothetical protein
MSVKRIRKAGVAAFLRRWLVVLVCPGWLAIGAAEAVVAGVFSEPVDVSTNLAASATPFVGVLAAEMVDTSTIGQKRTLATEEPTPQAPTPQAPPSGTPTRAMR